MAKKIFISYKYKDDNVEPFAELNSTTARDYVDKLQNILEEYDNINKGEEDGEDLSSLSETVIENKLKDRLYDSSITIVLISKNMREVYLQEKQQWIPWEISYSLKEITRGGRTSRINALIGIVLPDVNGSYDHAIIAKECQNCKCNIWQTNNLFKIIKNNTFNLKKKNEYLKDCSNKNNVYTGQISYMDLIRWEVFIKNPQRYIEEAIQRKNNIFDYNITKELQ